MTPDEAAFFSELVYAPEASVREAVLSLGWSCTPVIRNDTEAFVFGRNDGEYVVAFRGTSSFGDVLADLKVKATTVGEAKIHTGFFGHMMAVFEEVTGALDMPRTVSVTGHSLGGAVAQLFASRAEKAAYPISEVVTFGGPRVGNGIWKSSYDKRLAKKTMRFRMSGDPVPGLPFLHWGYRHTKGEVFIDRKGRAKKRGWFFKAFDQFARLTWGRKWDGKPDPIEAHSMTGYVRALKDG